MIKFPVDEEDRKFDISGCLSGVDGADLIPIDCGGRLITPTISANELGKQLLKAAGDGNAEETQNLLNKGALFTADWLGTSPLHLAARNNHLDVCDVLLSAGISRDARTKVDKTSLHLAAAEGHSMIVDILLDRGSDPDCKDLLGMTPLHWAVQNGHLEVVKSLVKAFAKTDISNKFNLTAADIAVQIERSDILEVLTLDHNEPVNAVEHLTLQLIDKECKEDISEENSESVLHSPIPLETILMEEEDNSIDAESLSPIQTENLAESMRLLQEHGITMLPNDDHNILNTVMETGHSVVLTDVGKQMLNSFKESEQKEKKFITVTPDLLIANKSKNILKQINGRLVPKNVKRIVMRKNKLIPVSSVNQVLLNGSPSEVERLMAQLGDARKTIEEYKVKLMKKEQEVERYKQQLKLLMDDS